MLDEPWIDKGPDGYYVNWFPMESSNTGWTNDLRLLAVALGPYVKEATRNSGLEPYSNYDKHGHADNDPYYIVHQILKHATYFAQAWPPLSEGAVTESCEFILEIRNAQAHNDLSVN